MRFPISIGLTVALALPPGAVAQQGHDLFQQALVLERVGGDLTGAMGLYQRILREQSGDRPLQARVLAQLGHGYELLGRPEAESTYERLVREFPDQEVLATLARTRLAQLRTESGADPTYLQLLAEAYDAGNWRATDFDFAPDGASFVTRIVPDDARRTGEFPLEVSALYIGHRDGRLPRLLWSSSGDSVGNPLMPRWSPDGRLIAFLTRPAPREGVPERVLLHVVPATGGTAKRVGEPILQPRVSDLRWTPDGRLAWTAGPVVQVRSLDGTTNELPGRVVPRTILGGFSSDGRWLAISSEVSDAGSANDRDVWLLNTETGVKTRITDRPGMDGFPVWGRDGSLYFVSSRGGARNVWRVAIDPQKGTVRGAPQQITFYLEADVGHLQRAGAGIGFTLIRSSPTVYVAAASDPARTVPTVRGRQPVLSPDGGTVYFLSRSPFREEDRPVELVAASRSDGTNRTLASNVIASSGSGLPGYDLSPDGRSIAFMGETEGARTLLTVETAGGAPKALVRIEGVWESTPRFSPDGARIAYANSTGLYVVARAGGEAHRIAEVPGGFEGWSLRWSPDGRQIAIFGYPTPNGNNAVYVVPTDGSGSPRQISSTDNYLEGLDWDPAGGRLTYHLSRRDSRTVQLPAAGGAETAFHDEPGVWDYRGLWAPEGRTYYFEGIPDNAPVWQVYRLDARTGAVARFASNNASLPNWSRDGRFMAWSESPSTSQLWLMENLP